MDARDDTGSPPFHKACSTVHLEVAKWLSVEHGADVQAERGDGSTAFYLACFNGQLQHCIWHVITFIWRYSSGLFFKQAVKLSPKPLMVGHHLLLAHEKGPLEIVKFLLFHEGCANGHLEIVKWLVAEGADVHVKTESGRTLLHASSYSGDLQIVQWLIEKGDDVHANDKNGSTPFHTACYCGHLEIVKWLLEKGADVHAKRHFWEAA